MHRRWWFVLVLPVHLAGTWRAARTFLPFTIKTHISVVFQQRVWAPARRGLGCCWATPLFVFQCPIMVISMHNKP